MPDKSWKAFERRVAKKVGGKRLACTGAKDGVPSYLRDWLRGIVGAGERAGSVGVVVWKPPRARDDDALVVLRLKDWEALHGA